MNIAILSSTRGTHLPNLMTAIHQNGLPVSIKLIMTNNPQAGILERAKTQGLDAQFIDPQHLTREEYDNKISNLLTIQKIDLIILIGYMRILSKNFVIAWQNKIINVHPSLLPAFAGGRDLNVHQAVLDAGVAETGCTVHYVTEEVDQGPIIVQKKCKIMPSDTSEMLKARVQILEGEALIEAILFCMTKDIGMNTDEPKQNPH